MLDLRKIWNFGSLFFGFAFPFLLGAMEATFRGAAGDHDPNFFPPALAAAALAALLPCLAIGERPRPANAGEPREAARTRREYNWNAWVLVLSVIWFVAGAFLWSLVLVNSIKSEPFPWWWPEFHLFGNTGVPVSETVAHYAGAVLLAILKLVKS